MTIVDSTTIYIVRHAEKADNSADPSLSADGLTRAKELIHVLADETIEAVFVTRFLRTQQTGAPIAAAAGVTPKQYTGTQDLVNTILSDHLGGHVLVVGHSDTADDIAAATGIPGLSDLNEHSFDRLFVINVLADGAHLIRLRYGVKTP